MNRKVIKLTQTQNLIINSPIRHKKPLNPSNTKAIALNDGVGLVQNNAAKSVDVESNSLVNAVIEKAENNTKETRLNLTNGVTQLTGSVRTAHGVQYKDSSVSATFRDVARSGAKKQSMTNLT